MDWLFALLGIVMLAFGGVIFFGAPYLPTLRPQVDAAFSMLGLTEGQTVLELGCGDGKVLLLAAERGYCAVGIELNPILVLIAWARTRRYGSQVRVIWGDYWRLPWPPADAVYVFLLDRFMPKLDARMKTYGGPLVSVAFTVPEKTAAKEQNGVFLYRYGAAKREQLA